MAEIPMLQGWYDQLAPGLQSISSGIANLINPHLAEQQQLKRQIAQNPEILQKLSDMEALSPGSVTGTFGKQVNQIIGSPSSEAQSESDLRNGRSLDNIQGSGDARSQLLGRSVTGVNAPTYQTQKDAATVSQASVQGKVKEAQLADKQATFDLANVDAKNRAYVASLSAAQKKAETDIQTLTAKAENYPKLKNLNIAQLARKTASGTANDQDAQAIKTLEGDEEAAKTYASLVHGYQQADELGVRMSIHRQSSAQLDKQLKQQAFSLLKEYNFPGSMQSGMTYLSDPNAQAMAEKFASDAKYDPKQHSELENDLREIALATRKRTADAQTNQQIKEQNEQFKARGERFRVSASIDDDLRQIDKAGTDEERNALISRVNQNLALLTGGTVQFDYKKNNKLWFDSQSFVHIDPQTGKATPMKPEAAKQLMYTDPMAQQQQKKDPVTEAWRGASLADRRKNLATIKDPTTRKAQEEKLRANGIEF